MADTKNKIVGVVLTLVAVIVILTFLGTGSSTELKEGADSITQANNCSGTDSAGVDLFYNVTSNGCQNSTGQSLYTPTTQTLPLSNLFSSTGVALLILMASILIGLIGYILKKVGGQ